MSDLKADLNRQLNEAHSKYVYYLLAVAAAAIGFAVHRSSGQVIEWTHSVLLVAVAFWLWSFAAGCQNRRYFTSTLYANIVLLMGRDGTLPGIPSDPAMKDAACDGIRKAAEENSNRMNRYGHLQFYLLICGGLAFLIWHIVEMATTRPIP